jgi:hypothetical protein
MSRVQRKECQGGDTHRVNEYFGELCNVCIEQETARRAQETI